MVRNLDIRVTRSLDKCNDLPFENDAFSLVDLCHTDEIAKHNINARCRQDMIIYSKKFTEIIYNKINQSIDFVNFTTDIKISLQTQEFALKNLFGSSIDYVMGFLLPTKCDKIIINVCAMKPIVSITESHGKTTHTTRYEMAKKEYVLYNTDNISFLEILPLSSIVYPENENLITIKFVNENKIENIKMKCGMILNMEIRKKSTNEILQNYKLLSNFDNYAIKCGQLEMHLDNVYSNLQRNVEHAYV